MAKTETKKAGPTSAPKKKLQASTPHPSYFQMIREAILALQERSGSSPYAIAKYMEKKHEGDLPSNFRKLLAVQLRNLTAKGKLVKVKASFKLSPAEKHVAKKMEKIAKPKVGAGKTNVVAKKGTKVKKLKSSAPARPTKKAAGVKPKSIKSPAAKKARKQAA